jgi:hypothetical protein
MTAYYVYFCPSPVIKLAVDADTPEKALKIVKPSPSPLNTPSSTILIFDSNWKVLIQQYEHTG